MHVWSRTTLKSLVLPSGILLMGIAALAHSGWLTLPLPAISFLFYCALIGGMLLAWRFHSTRIFSALVILFLAQQAVDIFGAHVSPGKLGLTGLQAAAVLVPLDFVLIALMTERGFTVSSLAPVGLLLFVESVVVAVLCRAQGFTAVPPRLHHVPPANFLPGYAWMAFALGGIFLLARTLFTRKPADSALLWSLAAFFLSLRFTATPRISTLYSVSAAFILATAIIENSYLLAYHDELTTLPSRRAFNDALQRLQHPYAIAAVDIDHFKRFNDTYGHDIGDQVLRLVATNLSRVTGGGQAYRCGGEEFSILFPGKTASEVATHLEQLRATIETSEFRMRAGDRRQEPRGPDRRNQRTRGRKGYAIRQLAQDKPPAPLSVTVSIGVAASTSNETIPESIIQAADKALYRAKANGRNRVEIATSPRPRTRTRVKAAGIA